MSFLMVTRLRFPYEGVKCDPPCCFLNSLVEYPDEYSDLVSVESCIVNHLALAIKYFSDKSSSPMIAGERRKRENVAKLQRDGKRVSDEFTRIEESHRKLTVIGRNYEVVTGIKMPEATSGYYNAQRSLVRIIVSMIENDKLLMLMIRVNNSYQTMPHRLLRVKLPWE